jgi:hypothetical protein
MKRSWSSLEGAGRMQIKIALSGSQEKINIDRLTDQARCVGQKVTAIGPLLPAPARGSRSALGE